ncbi:hypothetical protein D9M72_432300 [compost metagenome]
MPPTTGAPSSTLLLSKAPVTPFMEVVRKPGSRSPGSPFTRTVQITEISGSRATRKEPTTRQVASLSLALRPPSTAALQPTRPAVNRMAETMPQPNALKPITARMAAPTTRAMARTTYGANLGNCPLVSAERLRTGVRVEVI